MSGQWTTTNDKHCHIEFIYSDTSEVNHSIYFRDIRNFGTLRLSSRPDELRRKLQGLGSDILSELPLELENCLQI